MPRKTTKQSKEPQQPQPQPQEPEMPPSPIVVKAESADDPVVEEEPVGGPSGLQQPQKKRYRPSKRDIPDYPFTDAQVSEIAEFVKQNPPLYNKRDKQWCNPRLKETLWTELAATFPDCTFLQVRKLFEKKRTDFGKIEKKESTSGGPARRRTAREEEVMSTWEFLGGHIAHENALASDRFSPISQRATSDRDFLVLPSKRKLQYITSSIDKDQVEMSLRGGNTYVMLLSDHKRNIKQQKQVVQRRQR
ncbi:uncharacterized protein LOC143020922 isoform X2 [Oratosquilla oratoria]|uniref:uncharacterized protein LOC143020922 isoform X2 n=1 Tax=Oratosquilla oratoria TaxID=337810 RepID=UPI003F777D1D